MGGKRRREAFAWEDGRRASFWAQLRFGPYRGHPAIELLQWRGREERRNKGVSSSAFSSYNQNTFQFIFVVVSPLK
jgi:hypothetical protein